MRACFYVRRYHSLATAKTVDVARESRDDVEEWIGCALTYEDARYGDYASVDDDDFNASTAFLSNGSMV